MLHVKLHELFPGWDPPPDYTKTTGPVRLAIGVAAMIIGLTLLAWMFAFPA